MAPRFKTILLWIVSVVLTLAAAVYQRTTGPSYPASGAVEIDGSIINYSLPRSYEIDDHPVVEVNVERQTITGTLSFRRYNSHDPWTHQPMESREGVIVGVLPVQPPAGKIMYRLELTSAEGSQVSFPQEPVVLRFKGAVPLYILIPHVLLMFTAMLLSTRTAFEAIFARQRILRLAAWTTGCLLLGGMILGPVVQKFAFGAFWTGWPLGSDLTDNKTLVAFAAWVIALVRLRRRPNERWGAIVAAVILLAVYTIPHSMFGSELDHREVETTEVSVHEPATLSYLSNFSR